MEYGEQYQSNLVNRITGREIPYTATYKRAAWRDLHTDNEGNGLWISDTQLLGTCQFTVAGCQTEKAAIAKIRKYAQSKESEQ